MLTPKDLMQKLDEWSKQHQGKGGPRHVGFPWEGQQQADKKRRNAKNLIRTSCDIDSSNRNSLPKLPDSDIYSSKHRFRHQDEFDDAFRRVSDHIVSTFENQRTRLSAKEDFSKIVGHQYIVYTNAHRNDRLNHLKKIQKATAALQRQPILGSSYKVRPGDAMELATPDILND